MNVESMNMTIARSAPELVITAQSNAERWPPENKFKVLALMTNFGTDYLNGSMSASRS